MYVNINRCEDMFFSGDPFSKSDLTVSSPVFMMWKLVEKKSFARSSSMIS